MSDKNNVSSVNSGTASLKTVKLSGTIAVNDGGQAVPRVSINAEVEGSFIGSTWLESPAIAGAAWEITIPAQQEKTVTFSVNVYDSASGGNTIFRKTFSPGQTSSVSDTPISGIALDAGDISAGRLSGTVAFTNMPSPAPYRVSFHASYGEDSNWHTINSGAGSTITLSGDTGSWTIPRDDDFLAALESGSQTVKFYFYIQLNENESSIPLGSVEKTVGKDALSGIDLGSIAIPAYIKLSGTFTGTYNGATLPYVSIYARTETEETVGSVSITSPAASGVAWSLIIPAFDSPAGVSFHVTSSSDSKTLFYIRVSPPQTASVYNQSISGITINIGDVTSNTLFVTNPPSGSYTAYISTSYITQSNYSSVLAEGGYAAKGTGSSSPISLTWESGELPNYGYVLITAGGTTKYSSSVTFYNGIGSVDWNAMTEVSGGAPSAPSAPSAPTSLNASASGTSVSLSWNSVSGASSYYVYRSTSASGLYTFINNATGASYTDSGLTAGTYYYKVAVNVGGQESPQAGPVSATVSSGGAPSAPTGLNASASGTSVSLTWNSVSGATTYYVYRSTSASGSYTFINNATGASYTDSGLSAGTWYYKVAAYGNGQESPQAGPMSATVSSGGGGDTLAGAKGKLTLTGFNEFNGKYVYPIMTITEENYLIGINGATLNGPDIVISMVQISGGYAEVPLYYLNDDVSELDDYVPYDGSETLSGVTILILDDSDGKFIVDDDESLEIDYASTLTNNPSNTSFTPSTSSGSITISRSDTKTLAEIIADSSLLTTAKYMLMLPQ
jgi:hypothetical protein